MYHAAYGFSSRPHPVSGVQSPAVVRIDAADEIDSLAERRVSFFAARAVHPAALPAPARVTAAVARITRCYASAHGLTREVLGADGCVGSALARRLDRLRAASCVYAEVVEYLSTSAAAIDLLISVMDRGRGSRIEPWCGRSPSPRRSRFRVRGGGRSQR